MAAISLVLFAPAMAQTQLTAPGPAAAPPPGVPVTVAPVEKRDVPIMLRNIGVVQANQTVLMRARVDGTLEQVFFQEGQDVKRGDLIALIDPRPYQAAYDQAVAKKGADEATLGDARSLLVRARELVRTSATPQQTVDTRAATVAQLEAQVRSDDAAIAAAKVNLDYTSIAAPFDGHVGLRLIDPGNVIRAADPAGVGIVTISQIHPIAVTFTLPQDALPAIQAAMTKGKLAVTAYSGDGKTLLSQGTLLTTDNAVDSATGTIKLKAVFGNDDNRLWPGQFINAALQVATLAGAITVPSIAVLRGASGLYVFVAKPDSTVAVQPVEIGYDDGKIAVITKGLDDTAKVVVAGQSRLQNGARVTATPAKPSS